MTDTVRDLRAALESSHRRLDGASATLSAEDLAGPSYCTEWSVAQVLSHVGSQAEIFTLYLEAGLAGTDGPARDTVQAI